MGKQNLASEYGLGFGLLEDDQERHLVTGGALCQNPSSLGEVCGDDAGKHRLQEVLCEVLRPFRAWILSVVLGTWRFLCRELHLLHRPCRFEHQVGRFRDDWLWLWATGLGPVFVVKCDTELSQRAREEVGERSLLQGADPETAGGGVRAIRRAGLRGVQARWLRASSVVSLLARDDDASGHGPVLRGPDACVDGRPLSGGKRSDWRVPSLLSLAPATCLRRKVSDSRQQVGSRQQPAESSLHLWTRVLQDEGIQGFSSVTVACPAASPVLSHESLPVLPRRWSLGSSVWLGLGSQHWPPLPNVYSSGPFSERPKQGK